MTATKEIIMRTLLVLKGNDEEFTIPKLSKRSKTTIETTRKWVNAFIESGIVEKTDSSPFRGRVRDLNGLSITDFFLLYNQSVPKLY